MSAEMMLLFGILLLASIAILLVAIVISDATLKIAQLVLELLSR